MTTPQAPAPSPAPGRVGVLRPLRHRDFALLWSGLAVSMIGAGVLGAAAGIVFLFVPGVRAPERESGQKSEVPDVG